MRFAKNVFALAGLYGLATLVPMYFSEGLIAKAHPPALTHAEFFYGFIGIAVAWQVLFLVIARDPIRLRPAMLPAVLEKLIWGGTALVFCLQGRLAGTTFAFAAVDLVLAGLFVIAYLRTGLRPPGPQR